MVPERGEPRLATRGDQEAGELPFTEEKQLGQGFWSRLNGG
jgi:hypothetical protein